MSILSSNFGPVALDSVSAIAVAIALSVAVAVLAIRAGRWKVKVGVLPGFKSLPLAKVHKNKHGYRRCIGRYTESYDENIS
jgi:hypothetical protein